MTTLCKNCVSGHVLPGEPKGTIEDGAYVYRYAEDGAPEDGTPTASGKAVIILLTDGFGLNLKNPKVLADAFGERLKCDVLVPDMFNGTRTKALSILFYFLLKAMSSDAEYI